MELELHQDQKIRVKTFAGPYIDIRHIGYQSLSVALHGQCGYIEVRKKDREINVFQFPKKAYKKEYDFGWWEDAEVVFSYNEKGKDK